MKDKKNGMRRADLLRGIMAVLIIFLAMLARTEPGPVLLVLALIALLVFLAVEFFMNRCPHCGQYLGKNWGQFCQHCGERIREEKKQDT